MKRGPFLFVVVFTLLSLLRGEELFRLSIENREGENVSISINEGRTWIVLGKVLKPGKGRVGGFPASQWGRSGSVVASASHAIHIKIDNSNPPHIFSILPREFASTYPGFGGQPISGAGIVTDIPAGSLIFRDFAPSVGSHVLLAKEEGLLPLPEDFSLQGGEKIIIVVERKECPSEIVIENKKGGKAEAIINNQRITFGRVEKPFTGIGRFDATEFSGIGRINTVHPGAVTISTVPKGASQPNPALSGGFQIVPQSHAFQGYLASSPPYLVIAPVGKAELEGQFPLFDGTLNLWDFGGRGFRVQMKLDKGGWMDFPTLRGKIDNLSPTFLSSLLHRKCSEGITAIRIVCPKEDPKNLIREALGKIVSQRCRIVRGELSIDVRIEGEGASMVTLLIDGNFRGLKNFPPFSFVVDTTTLEDGEHLIELSAKDENGNTLASQSIKIFVDNQKVFE